MYNNPRNKFSAGRAPKKLVAGKFHKSTPKPREDKAAKPAPAKPVRKILTLDDMKRQLSAWAENERIPGKIQAWFTRESESDHCDWRIVNKLVNDHETLIVVPPAKGMEPPEIVSGVMEQLHKEHLKAFRKSLRQIMFRATGDGRFALLLQADFKGKSSAHAHKTFLDFVQRTYPQIISCHLLRCTPNHLFDPAFQQAMHVEAKACFGSNLMPIAGTGLYMHVLDWAPAMKDAWIELPQRIKDAIHPAKGDKFFEFFSGPSFVASALSTEFSQVAAMDCRESAMESSRSNAHNLPDENLKFYRSHLEPAFLAKFFSKKENEGRWTFYLNTPANEPLNTELVQAIAASRPERILLQVSDLENAATEIKRFRTEGYMLRKSVPLCLEPGSGVFEILMLFVPDRAGLLGGFASQNTPKRKVQRPQERISVKNDSDIPHFVQKKVPSRQRKD